MHRSDAGACPELSCAAVSFAEFSENARIARDRPGRQSHSMQKARTSRPRTGSLSVVRDDKSGMQRRLSALPAIEGRLEIGLAAAETEDQSVAGTSSGNVVSAHPSNGFL